MSFKASKEIDAAWDVTPVGKNSHANFRFCVQQEAPEQAHWQVATQPQLYCDPVAAF
jgi:hypothetical protein